MSLSSPLVLLPEPTNGKNSSAILSINYIWKKKHAETVVKLAPGDDTSPIRSFYLRLADEDEAQAWAQAIREMRFDYVRGERDALRSAKTCLTDQVRRPLLL